MMEKMSLAMLFFLMLITTFVEAPEVSATNENLWSTDDYQKTFQTSPWQRITPPIAI